MKYKAALPIPLLLILLIVLTNWNVNTVFEPPGLLFVLNTLFISVAAAVVAYLAARGYQQAGLRNLLLLGGGALAFGAASLVAGWFIRSPGGPNITLTVPGGRPGEIWVKLRVDGSGQLCLTVSDNGVGFPANVDPATTGTLGLQLVRVLTDHMRGQVEFSRNEGAAFTIRFSPLWGDS